MTVLEFCRQIPPQEEAHESLLSLSFYHQTVDSVLQFLQDQLLKARKIVNPIKKKKINDALFLLVTKYNSMDKEKKLDQLVFADYQSNYIHDYQSSEIALAMDFGMHPIFYKNDSHFWIEYMLDFFSNFQYTYVLQYQKPTTTIQICTLSKEKRIKKTFSDLDQIQEEIKKYSKLYPIRKNMILVHGYASKDLKWKDWNLIFMEKELSDRNGILRFVSEHEMVQNLTLLEKCLYEIENNAKTNLDLYVFGKLKPIFHEYIENYLLKELYIEKKKLKKLKEWIDIPSMLNFKIIEIESLEKGDIGERFIQHYNGLIGVKYF